MIAELTNRHLRVTLGNISLDIKWSYKEKERYGDHPSILYEVIHNEEIIWSASNLIGSRDWNRLFSELRNRNLQEIYDETVIAIRRLLIDY